MIEPLGLTRTFYGPDDLRAAGRGGVPRAVRRRRQWSSDRHRRVPAAAALTVDPAGAGLFSTIPDLLTVTHALFARGDVLAAAQRSLLSASVSTLTARDLLLDRRFVVHGHGGASPGAQTIVAYDATHGHDGGGLVQPSGSRGAGACAVGPGGPEHARARGPRAPPLTSGQRRYHEPTGTPRRVSGGDGRDGYVGYAVAPPAPASRVVRRRDRGDRFAVGTPAGAVTPTVPGLPTITWRSPTCRTSPSRSLLRRTTAARRCSRTGPPANRATVLSPRPATADRRPVPASVGSRSVGCTRARWPRGTG